VHDLKHLPVDLALEVAQFFPDGSRVSVESLPRNPWLTSAIWLVRDDRRSIVVKRTAISCDKPDDAWSAHWTYGAHIETHWNYWKREALAYQNDIPGCFRKSGILAPAALLVQSDGDHANLWLEAVSANPATQWRIAQYARAANALGRAQAGLLIEKQPLPISWLARDYLVDYSSEKPFKLNRVAEDEQWEGQLVADLLSRDLQPTLCRFGDIRQTLYQIVTDLPHTLCHNDFWTRNLFGDDSGPIFVIDWGFVGYGPIGADIGNLIPSAALDGFISSEDLPELETAVFDGYLEGLREGGWYGDDRLARLGMCASAVKYVWLGPAILQSAREPNHPTYAGYGGHDIETRFRETGRTLQFLADWGNEATDLAASIL